MNKRTKKRSTRDAQIVALAREQCYRDGECEIDETAIVSEGADNGAYVQAWVWVDFEGTDLDKNVVKTKASRGFEFNLIVTRDKELSLRPCKSKGAFPINSM